jgi:phosphoenolpyruvate-protein kinase (PTS system EI component)
MLIGLGASDLSMNPTSIPAVKATLAAYTFDEAHAFGLQALEAATLAEVEAVVARIHITEP